VAYHPRSCGCSSRVEVAQQGHGQRSILWQHIHPGQRDFLSGGSLNDRAATQSSPALLAREQPEVVCDAVEFLVRTTRAALKWRTQGDPRTVASEIRSYRLPGSFLASSPGLFPPRAEGGSEFPKAFSRQVRARFAAQGFANSSFWAISCSLVLRVGRPAAPSPPPLSPACCGRPAQALEVGFYHAGAQDFVDPRQLTLHLR